MLILASLACTCNLLNLTNGGGVGGVSSTPAEDGVGADPALILPELADLSELATVISEPVTVEVGPENGRVDLGEGASIQIPAGAFPSANQLQVTQVEIAFYRIAPDAREGNFYVIQTREDVPILGAPILLEIPRPSPDVTVVAYDGANWVQVPADVSDAIRIPIGHFSKGIFGIVEWVSEIVYTEDDPSAQRMRTAIEAGDQNVKGFFGVNEAAVQTEDEMCTAIRVVLQQYNTPANRAFPSTSGGTIGMADFLFAGSAPSEVGGPYWELTKGSMAEIGSKLLATQSPIGPAEFLKIAIDANNGNIPQGILAAHNYLKEITYKGRNAYKPGTGIPTEYGEPARHLQSWRQINNITGWGEYDKMGPIYHIFAAMTGGLWLPTSYSGPTIATGEAFLRTFRIGADRADTQKAAADQCGIDMAAWLRNTPPEDVLAGGQLTGTLVPVGLNPGEEVLANTITLTFEGGGSNKVTGKAMYGAKRRWEDCNLLLDGYSRWDLTGTYDPATRKINGTAQEFGWGQIAYTNCSVGDVPEYVSGEGGTWEATLDNGVVTGSITLIQSGGTPLLRVTFTAP